MMGQNEVGYLKGVLTRSETYTEAILIERNWRMQFNKFLIQPGTQDRVLSNGDLYSSLCQASLM